MTAVSADVLSSSIKCRTSQRRGIAPVRQQYKNMNFYFNFSIILNLKKKKKLTAL